MTSDCLGYALDIQRRIADPSQWGPAIDAIPDECRDECREYLRGMFIRARIARAARETMKGQSQ